MSVPLHPSLLDAIIRRRDDLAGRLCLDLERIPAFEGPPGRGPYPELDPALLETMLRGQGKAHLALTLDHSLLAADATPEKIDRLCEEAIACGVAAVCVNGAHVARAAANLADHDIPVAAVVGFPLGQASSRVKCAEARQAAADGAGEIDMVANLGWLRSGRPYEVLAEIQDVIQACGLPVKVIIETALLSTEEKIDACLLARFAQAAFVKTSTGFSSAGASVSDVALMRAVVGRACGVKASGGVRTRPEALAMLRAGANRIGTSSAVAILEEGP